MTSRSENIGFSAGAGGRQPRPRSVIEGDLSYERNKGRTSQGRRPLSMIDDSDARNMRKLTGSHESNLNGYTNTTDASMHGGRKSVTTDSSADRGYFARLSSEEKARHVNSVSSDQVRQSVRASSEDGPVNNFRRLSVSSNDGQGDPRKAAKQMYAEFSYSPQKKAVEKYIPPTGPADGLAPRRRDHDIRVIPKKTQSSSVSQLKGLFDTHSPSDRPSPHNRTPVTTQIAARDRKDSDDRSTAVVRPYRKEQEREHSESESEEQIAEGLASRRARFQQAESMFKKGKTPPPPVKLEELIKRDKPQEEGVKAQPREPHPDKHGPQVAPKPTKRITGNLERNIDKLTSRQKNESPQQISEKPADRSYRTRAQSYDTFLDDRKPKQVDDSPTHTESSRTRKASDPINVLSYLSDSTSPEPDDVIFDDQYKRNEQAIRLVERKRSGSGSRGYVDVHEMRRKMPPRRSSSVEFKSLEESVEVYGKTQIDINAILGIASSDEKPSEEVKTEMASIDPAHKALEDKKDISSTDDNEEQVKNKKDEEEGKKEEDKREDNTEEDKATVQESQTDENRTMSPPLSTLADRYSFMRTERERRSSQESSSSESDYSIRRRQNSMEKKEQFFLGKATRSIEEPKPKLQENTERIENRLMEEVVEDSPKIEDTPKVDAEPVQAVEPIVLDSIDETKTAESKTVVEEIVEEVVTPTKVAPVQEAAFDFGILEGNTLEEQPLQYKEEIVQQGDTGDVEESITHDSSSEVFEDSGHPVKIGDNAPSAEPVSMHKETEVCEGDESETKSSSIPEDGTSSADIAPIVNNAEVEETEMPVSTTDPENETKDLGNSLESGGQNVDKEDTVDVSGTHKTDEEVNNDSKNDDSKVEEGDAGLILFNTMYEGHLEHGPEPPLDEVSISHEGKRKLSSQSSFDGSHKEVTSDTDPSTDGGHHEVEEASGDEADTEGQEYDVYPEEIDLPPPPERSCLTRSKGKARRNVVIKEQPSSVIFTYGPTEYDRGNPEIDPVTASAEWELEKRVENMDVFSVDLDKDDRGLGLSIIGLGVGTESGVEKLGIFVKSLTDGGSAQRDGRIQVKDQILEVNGVSLVGVTQQFAAKTLKETRGAVRFLMGRDKSPRHYNYDPSFGDPRQLIKELEERHNDEIRELLRRYQDADERANYAERTLEDVRVELCDAEERAHKAHSDMEEVRSELNFVRNSSFPPAAKMKNEIKKHKPQETKKSEKIDQLQKVLQDISEKLAASEKRLGQLHQENIDKQGELQSVKEKLEETEQEHQNSLVQNEKAVKSGQEKEARISQLEAELLSTKSLVAEQTKEKESYQKHCRNLEQELEDIKRKLPSDDLNLKIHGLEETEKRNQEELKRLKMENETLTNGLHNREGELRKLADDRAHLEEKIKELESGHEEMRNIHSNFANKEEEYKEHIRKLEEKLQNLSKEPTAVKVADGPPEGRGRLLDEDITIREEIEVESKPNTAHLLDVEDEVIAEVDIGVQENERPLDDFVTPNEEVLVESKPNTAHLLDIEDEVAEVDIGVQESAPSDALIMTPSDTVIPTNIIPALELVEEKKEETSKEHDVVSDIPERAEVTSAPLEDSAGVIVEGVKGSPEEHHPVDELKDINPVPKPPRTDFHEKSEKSGERTGGLIEFQYNPGGPFFPDLSDMPESNVDSTSESETEESKVEEENKKPITEAIEEVHNDGGKESEAKEEKSDIPVVSESDKEKEEGVDQLDSGSVAEKGDRSSFLESLRENPSFKAWLDEEWNIVSQKIKDEEADKIAQQVIDSTPVLPNRTDRENEDIIIRSGSQKLDESYFKRTVVIQESVDPHPKLLTEDSVEPDEVDTAPAEPQEPVKFDVPDTNVLNTTPQLDKLRIARERSHRKPSSPRSVVSGVDLENQVPLSDEAEETADGKDESSSQETTEEQKKERKVAEVQPMPANQLLFKELAAAAAARPQKSEESPKHEEKPATDEMENHDFEPREQPVAKMDEPVPITLESHKDHKGKSHKILGIQLPKISFGKRRKSQEILDVDVPSGGESSGKESTPPLLTSERRLANDRHEDTLGNDEAVVPFASKENLHVEEKQDSVSTDEAVVPFAEKLAVNSGSRDNLELPDARSPSDNAVDSAPTSLPSSGAVSPADRGSRNLDLGSQDSLDGLASGGEDTEIMDKSFSTLHWMQKSVNEWDTRQVGLLMIGMGLEDYVNTFQNKGINGPEFMTLNGSKLKDLGVHNADHRAAIKKKVKELKSLEKERSKAKDHKDAKKEGKAKDGRLSKTFWKGKYTLN